MASLQPEQQRPLQQQPAQSASTPISNPGNLSFAAGLQTPPRSNQNGLGSQIQRAAEAVPAVTANTATQAALGALAITAAVTNPMAALMLPAIDKTLFRTTTPLPLLTSAIAGISLITSAIFRPIGIGSLVGSMVAGGALMSAMKWSTAAAPAKLPKP